ncbi:hypothetical protein Scep_006975 [Stephania cephalantha]|uniref:Uncharacterized protein n=1 Tax=Stephania cephalantha TaxID=152367 RepID=A0AAP0KAP9_9MAGN
MSVSDLYLAGGVSFDDSSRVVEEFLLGVDVLVEGVVAELERVGSCSSFAKIQQLRVQECCVGLGLHSTSSMCFHQTLHPF